MSNVKMFKGRPVLSGEISGEAAVSKAGFNASAAFLDVLFQDSQSGVCQDAGNKDLYQVDIAGKILCVPKTIGSSAAATAYAAIVERGIAPAAMLFAEPIDSLAACGLIMADNWVEGERIVTIDQLGSEFLAAAQSGDRIEVFGDGRVAIHS